MSDSEGKFKRATDEADDLPMAQVRSARGLRWVWLIPVAAVVFAGVLLQQYVIRTGPVITIRMSDGHGIRAGDPLRCRGIVVGEVQSARLNEAQDGVVLRVRLDPDAQNIARSGSRFWVVRPRLGLRGVGGIETIVGPRYLVVRPGDGSPRRQFVALDEPPTVDRIDPEGLELTLTADRRHGLRAGAPILYRQIPIGKVLSVGLASDATTVEVRAYIRPAYTSLVRDNSRFWNVSGLETGLGVTGFSLEFDSIESLVVGGVAIATPRPPGGHVSTGHRFKLHGEPEDEWRQWRPSLAVGTELLPPGAARPDLRRATLRTSGGFFGTTRRRKGWLLPMPAGLVGPADLLKGEDEEAELEVAGQRLTLSEQSIEAHGDLAVLDWQPEKDPTPWPAKRIRAMESAEDCLIFTDVATPPVPLASAQLQHEENGKAWRVSAGVSLDRTLHGAAVVARSDARIVGVLLIGDRGARVVPIPDAIVTDDTE